MGDRGSLNSSSKSDEGRRSQSIYESVSSSGRVWFVYLMIAANTACFIMSVYDRTETTKPFFKRWKFAEFPEENPLLGPTMDQLVAVGAQTQVRGAVVGGRRRRARG